MPLIQNPSIARKLQRFLRLIHLPDSVLAPEIVGVVLVEDLSAPLSDLDRGCMGATGGSAVAAEVPLLTLVQVGNPPTYSARVTGFHVSSPAGQVISLISAQADVTGITASGETGFTDLALPGRPTSQFGTANQAALPAGQSLLRFGIPADTPIFVPIDILLGPPEGVAGPGRTTLVIAGETVNTALRGGFQWTESAPRG